MGSLALILTLSSIIWYIIDRFKANWANYAWGKYVTMTCAAVFGFSLVFGYDLDIIYSLGLVTEITLIGKLLTGVALMSGSSAIAEIIERVKGK